MMLIERNDCPFCGNLKLIPIKRIAYNDRMMVKFLEKYYKSKNLIQRLSKSFYEIIECSVCKGIFQKYIPDNKFSEYLYNDLISKEESFKKKFNNYSNNSKQYSKEAKLIEKLLSKKSYEINILEFGCGWGFWSKFMKSLNFNVETCEISKSRIDFLEKNNLRNYTNVDLIKKKYDFIFSDQVFEHVGDPLILLKKLSELLKENGYMYHKFPSSLWFKNKVKKKNYLPKKDCAHPLEHINIFNKNCFLTMAGNSNLSCLQLKDSIKLPLINKIKSLKNYFLFNSIILKKSKKLI